MTALIPRDAVRNEVARLGKEFLDGGSPTAANVLNLAMDRINAIPPIDPAAIREAALKEAYDRIGAIVAGYDLREDFRAEEVSGRCYDAILAAIPHGEK